MNEEGWWGALFICYIIPFGLWQMLSYDTFSIREKLFPGKSQIELMGFNIDYLSLAWCIGFGLLLIFNAMKAPALIAAILLFLIFGFLYGTYRIFIILSREKVLTNKKVRLWISLSITWISSVIAYVLIFGSNSSLEGGEFVLLAILPPLVLAIAFVSWSWANNAK